MKLGHARKRAGFRYARTVVAAIPLLLAGAVVGCAEHRADVSGVVTSGGRPVPSAVVAFHDATGRVAGVGRTDAAGEFVVEDGLTPGSYGISIYSSRESAVNPDSSDPLSASSSEESPDTAQVRIPEPFTSHYTSGLRENIGADFAYRLDLKLD